MTIISRKLILFLINIYMKNEPKDFDTILSSSFLIIFYLKTYISSGASTPSRRNASFKTREVALASAKRA